MSTATNMSKFTFGTFEEMYRPWARHHKQLGICVKRVFNDDRADVLPKNPEMQQRVLENKDKLLSKTVTLIDRGSDKTYQATDYYLPLTNQDYKEPINYFSSGASNTRQTIGIRYKFMLEESVFWLESIQNVRGNYPFSHFLDVDGVEEVIYERAEECNVEFDGIGMCEEYKDHVQVIIVDEVGRADIIDIPVSELVDHLVGAEIFSYDLEIIDSTKEE